jgi:hypothetical protein
MRTKHAEPFVCQKCGPVPPELEYTHKALYVHGDWEGFPTWVREQLDPTLTYLVNPAHPDCPSAPIRFHPERRDAFTIPWADGGVLLVSVLLLVALAVFLIR